MPTLDGEQYVGSFLQNVPFIRDVENRVDKGELQRWQTNYWSLSVVASVMYLILLYLGKRYMKYREPCVLQKPLFLWNVGLAVFSILGTLSSAPNLLHLLYRKGFIVSSCRAMLYDNSSLLLWSVLFALSKIVEFGDTFFLVVRKSPLQFLHWYHHITVLMYSWYGLGMRAANAHWFGSMNYAVHSLMYSYFAVRAAGWRVPMLISKAITFMQIAQMLMGLAVNLAVYAAFSSGQDCDVTYTYFYVGIFIYGSYTLLFTYFFYTKYVR